MAQIESRTWGVGAVGSTSYDERAADAAKRVDQLVGNSEVAILVDIGCQKELATLGLSAAQTLSEITDYMTARRAAGWDQIVASTVPGSTFYDAAAETQRLALNDLIRASAAFDAVIDLAADPRLDDGADLTYFADGVHFTAEGADVAASIAVPTLATLGIT